MRYCTYTEKDSGRPLPRPNIAGGAHHRHDVSPTCTKGKWRVERTVERRLCFVIVVVLVDDESGHFIFLFLFLFFALLGLAFLVFIAAARL